MKLITAWILISANAVGKKMVTFKFMGLETKQNDAGYILNTISSKVLLFSPSTVLTGIGSI